MVDADGKAVPWFDGAGNELTSVRERFRPAPGQTFMLIAGGLVGSSVAARDQRQLHRRVTRRPHPQRRAAPAALRRSAQPARTRAPRHLRSHGRQRGQEPGARVRDLHAAPGSTPTATCCRLRSCRPTPTTARTIPRERRSRSGARASAAACWPTGICARASRDSTPPDAASTAAATTPAPPRAAGTPAARRREHARGVSRGRGRRRPARRREGPRLRSRAQQARSHRLEGAERRHLPRHAGLLRTGQERGSAAAGPAAAWPSSRESDLDRGYAANPHELGRMLECQTIITVGEMVMHASLARRASSAAPRLHAARLPGRRPSRVAQARCRCAASAATVATRELPARLPPARRPTRD